MLQEKSFLKKYFWRPSSRISCITSRANSMYNKEVNLPQILTKMLNITLAVEVWEKKIVSGEYPGTFCNFLLWSKICARAVEFCNISELQ